MGTAGNSNALLMWSKMRRGRIINDPITQARWYAPRSLNMIFWLKVTHLLSSYLLLHILCSLSSHCSDQVPWPFDLFQSDFQCAIVSLVTMFGEGCQSLGFTTFFGATIFGATSLNFFDVTVVSLSNWSNLVALLIKFNQWGLRATRFNFQSGQKQSTRSWLPW